MPVAARKALICGSGEIPKFMHRLPLSQITFKVVLKVAEESLNFFCVEKEVGLSLNLFSQGVQEHSEEHLSNTALAVGILHWVGRLANNLDKKQWPLAHQWRSSYATSK